MADRATTSRTADDRRAAAAQVFVEEPAEPTLSPEDRHHLSRVLRLGDGERVVAADGRGTWVLCAWQADDTALVPVAEPGYEAAPGSAAITVAFAPAKGDRPEWVVQKLTEVGVDVIVPLVTERGVVRWHGARGAQAVARLRRVSVAAAAQCRRVHLPDVREPVTLAELAEPSSAAPVPPGGTGTVAVADPDGTPLTAEHRVVAIGPEGGWSADERALELPSVTLSPHVLRAETAAVAAGVLMAAFRAGTVAPTVGGSSGSSSSKGRRAPG